MLMLDQQIIIAAYGFEKSIAPTEEIRVLKLYEVYRCWKWSRSM